MAHPIKTNLIFGILSKSISMLKFGYRLFTLASIVLIVIGSINIYKAYNTTNWPSIKGRITSSEITTRSDTYRDSTTNRLRDETYYNAQIIYEYEINGITYSNDDVKVGGTIGTNTTTWARETLNQYPKDKIVNVYYNPENPSQSVLEVGLHFSTWFPLAMGLGIFIFSRYIRSAFFNLGGPVSSRDTGQGAISETESPISSQAKDPRLIGKWEVIYQNPTYKELAEYSMKHFNFSDDGISPENIIIPEGKMTVTITDKKIAFKMPGSNLLGGGSQKYTLHNNRIVLAPLKLNIFMKAMAAFIPSYYNFTFSDSTLILTSNKIKGYDNQSVTYHLKRV